MAVKYQISTIGGPKMKKTIAVLVLFSTMVFAQQKYIFTDSRDNKTYKAVRIASQWWMAENLNYAASGSKCYDNNPANCKKYGRLYDWNTAMKACPYGWHLPSRAEWDMLMAAVDGEETARKKLKARSGWYGSNGTDQYGFSALPGGEGYPGGGFDNVGSCGYWWSAAEYDASFAFDRYMCYDYDVDMHYGIDKFGLFSVRCLQD
jgi:uncharacterized protein (TIGR02145 family)